MQYVCVSANTFRTAANNVREQRVRTEESTPNRRAGINYARKMPIANSESVECLRRLRLGTAGTASRVWRAPEGQSHTHYVNGSEANSSGICLRACVCASRSAVAYVVWCSLLMFNIRARTAAVGVGVCVCVRYLVFMVGVSI